MSKSEEKKIFLTEEEMPKQWYNINPDLPKPLAPPLNPQTGKPLGPDDLSVLFSHGADQAGNEHGQIH